MHPGQPEVPESEKGMGLIACLGDVVIRRRPQEINVMDRSNGKTIVSIPVTEWSGFAGPIFQATL